MADLEDRGAMTKLLEGKLGFGFVLVARVLESQENLKGVLEGSLRFRKEMYRQDARLLVICLVSTMEHRF